MLPNSSASGRRLALLIAGAHVDPELDKQYLALSRANSLGWEFRTGDIGTALDGRPEPACIRQIAHELLLSIHRFVPKFSQAAAPPVPSDKALLTPHPVT
jgi:hypothetical protein